MYLSRDSLKIVILWFTSFSQRRFKSWIYFGKFFRRTSLTYWSTYVSLIKTTPYWRKRLSQHSTIFLTKVFVHTKLIHFVGHTCWNALLSCESILFITFLKVWRNFLLENPKREYLWNCHHINYKRQVL